jgi:hypothetical protein
MNMNYVWSAWFVAWVVAFAGFETYAIMTGNKTLSVFVRDVSAAWGPLQFLAGLVVGGLAVHFWWAATIKV